MHVDIFVDIFDLSACLPGWLSACLSVQVGEPLGPVRALSEGKPGELFVGTTKNAIIRAAFPDTLTPIVQVLALPLRPNGPWYLYFTAVVCIILFACCRVTKSRQIIPQRLHNTT